MILINAEMVSDISMKFDHTFGKFGTCQQMSAVYAQWPTVEHAWEKAALPWLKSHGAASPLFAITDI